jgi:Thioredoxin like C-terminal domain
MLLLIVFGFVAGAATALSPCVLPVLPVALSAGVTGGRANFNARRVFLVLGSPRRRRHVRVLLDGRPLPASLSGADVHDSIATVCLQRLYRLVELPSVQHHVLTVDLEPGVTGYAFTFG